MIGPIKATWYGNDVLDTKMQTLRVTVYGTRKRGQEETVLSYADVQVIRKKRPFGFEWVGPEGLKVVFAGKEISTLTRVSCSVPEEIEQTYVNLGITRKEIDMAMSLPELKSRWWNEVTVVLPATLVSFRG